MQVCLSPCKEEYRQPDDTFVARVAYSKLARGSLSEPDQTAFNFLSN